LNVSEIPRPPPKVRPTGIDDQRLVVSIVKLIDKPAMVVEHVDPAVAKVADQDSSRHGIRESPPIAL